MHTERCSAFAFTGYPTLLTLVGIDATDDVVYRGVKTTVDGINVWPKISGGNGTRREFLPVTEVSLIWKEQFKLLIDAKPTWWYTPNDTHVPDGSAGCDAEAPCLFDLQTYVHTVLLRVPALLAQAGGRCAGTRARGTISQTRSLRLWPA